MPHATHIFNFSHRVLTFALVTALACVLTGCAKKTAPPLEPYNLRDFKHVDNSPARKAITANAIPHLQNGRILVIQKFTFPRFSPKLKLAMNMLDPAIQNTQLADLWRANGLGLKRISRASLGMFMANVPPSSSHTVSQVVLASNFRPITLTSDGKQSNRVRVIGEGERARTIQFSRGQYQLLVKPLPAAQPSLPPQIELLPIHHKEEFRFEPVAPDQLILDGTPIHDLNLLQTLGDDEIWAFFPNIPLPPSYNGEPTFNPPSDKPILLGQAMLTGSSKDQKHSQMILLIGYAINSELSDPTILNTSQDDTPPDQTQQENTEIQP